MSGSVREILNTLLNSKVKTDRDTHGNLIYGSYEYQDKKNIDLALTQIINIIKKKIPKKDTCQNPTHTLAQYISQDMAIDAGDKELEGTLFSDEKWEKCGACPDCIHDQLIDTITAALSEEI